MVKWWECKQAAKIKTTGTTVMLLGDSAEADSLPASWSQNTIAHYMSWRYEKTKIPYINDLRVDSKRSSRPLGLLQILEDYTYGQDRLYAPNGTQLDVYYVDVPKVKTSFKTDHYCSAKTHRGFSAIAYKSELYHSTGGKINARSWGITADGVIEKIIIIVRPP